MPAREYYLPQRGLTSQQDAALVPQAGVQRSRFHNTWTRKTTFDAGYIIPFLVDDIGPGDHMSYDISAYIRMQTPVFPVFDNLRVDTFIFFTPYRLLWAQWPRFMGEQTAPAETINLVVPLVQSPAGGFAANSLADHLGLPGEGQINPGERIEVVAFPFRAYNLIYNEWFKDQNLINNAVEDTGDATVLDTDYVLRRRAKAHDYFTSALPWTQKFTAPTIPLAGTAPVRGIGSTNQTVVAVGPTTVYETGGITSSWTNYKEAFTAAQGVVLDVNPGSPDAFPNVYADLTLATGVAVNTFRQAFMIQTLLERDARGGTRYVELIKSHFGVTSPDFRLQRPEYIGGGQSPLNITPIAQTAPDGAGDGLGALGGAGTSAGQHRATYAATEHGVIMGFINVRSELSYQQGTPRYFLKRTRYDFNWPELQLLGEQAITRAEIYTTGSDALDIEVFGYQERYHEYRTRYSEVTGMFRSRTVGNIDEWHLAQDFASAPALNQTFIEDTPPMDRILQASSLAATMQFLADIHIKRIAVRPLSTYGVPATLARF